MDGTSPKQGSATTGGGADDTKGLLAIVRERCSLFHTGDGEAYLSAILNGRRETMPVESAQAESFMQYVAWKVKRWAPTEGELRAAERVLKAQAKFESPVGEPAVRVAERNGKLYIDTADDAGHAVEIDPDAPEPGWRIIDDPPVPFLRPPGMLPLPLPVEGGSLQDARPFFNFMKEEHFHLAMGWVLSALRPRGPYPILVVTGAHGGGKSTTCRIARNLVDPNAAPIAAAPKSVDDLMVSMQRSHAHVYDNLSGFDSAVSDGFCQVSTGASHVKRQLYTTRTSAVLKVGNPLVLNGIGDVTAAADLLDRSLTTRSKPIATTKSERSIYGEFEEAHPRIFGAICTALSHALRNFDQVATEHEWPRMADAAQWITAAEHAETVPWEPGTFLAAHANCIDDAHDLVLERWPIGLPLLEFTLKTRAWEGNASTLLGLLSESRLPQVIRHRDWPSAAHILTRQLERLTPSLAARGVLVETRLNRRHIRLTLKDEHAATTGLAMQRDDLEVFGMGAALDARL